MLSTLCKIAIGKNQNEDSFFVKENEDYVWGGVFDGCSSGLDTHFASTFFKHVFSSIDVKDLFHSFHYVNRELLYLKQNLNLSICNFESTIIIFKYYKIEKKLCLRIFGDGVFWINGVQTIVDQNDEPDYFVHHCEMLIPFLDKTPIQEFENVNKFIICSDGILRIKLHQSKDSTIDPIELLSGDILSTNHLDRKYNILRKQGWENQDDLTMVYYENN